MKIAVASSNEMVSEHFGHCKNFNFFEIVDGKVISEESVDNPGHDCKALPQFLKDNNMEALISGGIGRGAMNNLIGHSIEVVSGASGLAKEAALEFEKGNLKSSGKICSHDHDHDHHHGHGHGHHHHHNHNGCK